MSTWVQDVRFALRSFAKNPWFSLVAVLSLAIGIGANTSIFSVANALLFRPLPYQNPDRLVILWNRSPGLGIAQDWFSTAQYFDIKNGHSGFEQVAIAIGGNYNLTGQGEPERVGAIRVSSNLFAMLGARPALGRLLTTEEDSPGLPATAVLTDGMWSRRFGRDPHVIGTSITINGQTYQVAGILPQNFSLPQEVVPLLDGTEQGELFLPLPLSPAAASLVRDHEDYNIVGKLKTGVSLMQAQAEMDTITARLRRDFPENYPPNGGLTFSIVPLLEQVVGNVRRSLWVLLGAVGFVLLIACANVANLMLSRAVARQQEIAVRTALGASRWDIIRQLLTESLLISLCGGALGVLICLVSMQGIHVLGTKSIPRLQDVGIDGRVLLFTMLLSIFSGILFGLFPALRVSRLDLNSTLKDTTRGSAGANSVWGRGNNFRRLLVISELALSVVLLIGAGLLIRSFVNDAHPVVVISYQLWRNRFKGDPEIIGKTQTFNNVPHTIIGVAPKGFHGTFVGWAMQFWVPASMEETFEGGGYKLDDRGERWIESYVRLKPAASRAQAQQEVSALASRLEKDYAATNRGRGIRLWPLWQTPFNHARTMLPTLEVMVAVVAFVLLIACANVGNLLLVRSFARRHEMSVRLAIGASRVRLLKQLLTEGFILSALGTAGGFLMAYWCRHALVRLLPTRSGVAMYLPGEIDWPVMALSGGICLMVTMIVGLVPALQSRKLDLAGQLKAESSSVVGVRSSAWMRSGLVVFQVCLSFVLLVGAALLLESLHKIRNTSPGFSTNNVVVTHVSLVAAGYDIPRARIFQDELMDRLNGLPGIESAAYAGLTPLGYATFASTPIAVDGYQSAPDEQPSVDYNQVSPGYFATLGIPLVSGREFARTDDENAPLVAIVNRTMVARYWGSQDPVGHRLKIKGQWARVVGVAADAKYESMRETAKPFFYVPLRQDFVRGPALNIRTEQPLQSVSAALLREVHALDRNLALYEMTTLQEQVNRSTSPQLVAVTLVSLLGSLALLLAGVGLYGVMSYAVAQSTRELGLRMALGAGADDLLRLVVSRGLRLVGGGVLFGTVAALALTRLLGKLLYDVSPHDPLMFGSVLAVMTITGISACLLPAWRASHTDPARALRD